jgi:RHS repeat-associated protein
VEYSYNTLGELTGIPGYVTETSYNSRGMLEGITAANGINHSYSYDSNGRLEGLSYTNQGIILKSYGYTYDGANNIRSMVKDGYSYTQPQTSSYSYNSLNQLIFAGLEGKFELASDPHKDDQYTGRVLEDYEGQETIREVQNTELIELDYAAGSIGVALGGTYPVTRLELTPDSPVHRVEERNLDVYYSTNNYEYTEVAQGDYELTINEEGQIKIIFTEPVSARYIKIKSYFDDRDENFEPVNKAEFVNEAQDIIKVYYYVSERAENYSYDAVGNRIEETITQRYTTDISYSYYSNSSRLKERVTDDGEKTAYVYDNNGNLIKKGTGYTISGDGVTLTPDGEHWEYEYDLLDRLTKVKKNGVTVTSYTYNHEGLRIKKENLESTTYHTFGLNGEVLYEQEDTGYMEYIYVGGQHFARVDGDVISGLSTTYFYHTDHLGSVVLVTAETGQIIWSTEYTPFGSITLEEGQLDFTGAIKFTGKDLDEDTGLYYYNARWYDAEIGRFISADTYKGELENPQTLNLYVYVANNPLIYVDPSGCKTEEKSNLFTSIYNWFFGIGNYELDKYITTSELNIPEERLPLLINNPYPDVPLGDPNDFYFPANYSEDLVKNMVSEAGQMTDVPPEMGLLIKTAMQFVTNIEPDEKAIPPLKRQQKINQILYEWNKRLLNPNTVIMAADWNVYRYNEAEANLRNVLNSASETIVGSPLDLADAFISYTAMQPIPPVIKSAFQPRLPRYKPGDISLTVSYVYTYKEGTSRSGITHINFFKHWTDKVSGRLVPEGGADWLYINQLELQIREGY